MGGRGGGCVYFQDNEHITATPLLVMPSTVAAKVSGEFNPGSGLMEGLLRRVTLLKTRQTRDYRTAKV